MFSVLCRISSLKNEKQQCKIGPVWGWVSVEVGKMKGEGKRGLNTVEVFYKPCMKAELWNSEIVLRSREPGWGGGIKGVNLNEVACMLVWKCHNETFLYNRHMLIKITLKNPKYCQKRKKSEIRNQPKIKTWSLQHHFAWPLHPFWWSITLR
jgi:hypothetical protein